MPPRKKRATAKVRRSQAAELTNHDNTTTEDNLPKSALLTTRGTHAKRTIQYPNGLESVMAPFDEKSGQFVQTIKLKSDKLFSTKPVLIEEGELKGRRVIVLEPEPTGNEVFPFSKLPPEIRIMIYSYLFERPGDPVIIYGRGQPRLNSIFRASAHRARYTDLTRVNRQIHTEANRYLYNSYKFEFSEAHMLNRFLSSIGPENTRFLANVELDRLKGRQAAKALGLLSSALSLKSFAIGGRSRDVAQLLHPMIQAMCDAGRDLEDALRMISWSGSVRYSCPVHYQAWYALNPEDCDIRKEAVLAKEESIRYEIRELLERSKAEAKNKMKEKQETKEKILARINTRAGRRIKAVNYSLSDNDDDGD